MPHRHGRTFKADFPFNSEKEITPIHRVQSEFGQALLGVSMPAKRFTLAPVFELDSSCVELACIKSTRHLGEFADELPQ